MATGDDTSPEHLGAVSAPVIPSTAIAQLAQAICERGESLRVEFKTCFRPDEPGAWPELVKDIVALANAGGGLIGFGFHDDGSPAPDDLQDLLTLDIADIVNQVQRFTDAVPPDIRLAPMKVNEHPCVVLCVDESRFPIVLCSDGHYSDGGRSKFAFRKGTIYVRHPGKCEPATSADLRAMFDRETARRMNMLRRVIEAPTDAEIVVRLPEPPIAGKSAVAFRLSNDPNAPCVQLRDDDWIRNYPHDYRSLSKQMKLRVPGFLEGKPYHEARKRLEGSPALCYIRYLDPNNPRSGSKRRYSEQMVEALCKELAEVETTES